MPHYKQGLCLYTNPLLGDSLISSGDDGTVRFWKRSLSGEWLEFAETDLASQ